MSTVADPLEAPEVVAVQRRTVQSLVGVQAIGAVGMTIGIATASLLARDVSGSDEQAGLAQTAQVFGTAVAAFALARLMDLRGRRIGQVVGYLTGAAGGLLCVLGGVVSSMPVLLTGALLLGATSAANNASRYAAADLAPAPMRARALSVVVWATTIGAVAGPNLTGPAAGLAGALGLPELTGPFLLGSIGMLVAALVAWLRMRPDPLLYARELAGEKHLTGHRGRSFARLAEAIRHRPLIAAAIACLASAHAVMVSVMVMTPLHMEHGGAELRIIGVVISVHVLGMFAFAPLSGWLADRLGRGATIALGGVGLLAAVAIAGRAPEGTSVAIFAGLFLLGLGWSLATVAASTLLTELAPLDARTDVQGAADMLMSLAAAGGAGLAGIIVGEWGYGHLNAFAAVLSAGVLFAAVASLRASAREA